MRADKEQELRDRAKGIVRDTRSHQLKADPTSMEAGLGNGFLSGRLVRDMYCGSAATRR